MKRFIVTILLAAFSTSLTLLPINVHAEISQKEASFGDTTVEKALDSSLLSGKNSCSFLLDISDGYDVITDENAVPEIEINGDSGTALFAAAISPDRRKVCITGATSEVAFSPDISISLRFYYPNDIERSSQQPYSAISSIIDLETQDESLRGVNTVAIYEEEERLTKRLNDLKSERHEDADAQLEAAVQEIESTQFRVESYDDVLVRKLIECIRVLDAEHIQIIFKGGVEITAKLGE